MNRQHHSEQHAMVDKAALRHEAAPAPQSDLSTGQQSMLAAQQSVGNQAVIRRMTADKANAVQRMPPFEEMNIPVSETPATPSAVPTGMPAPAGATDPAGGGQSITGPGGSVDVSGSGVAINSNGPIALNAAMTQASGMIQTPVIMADSVIGGSYTPGAGNVW